MTDERTILNKNTGRAAPGYIMEAHTWNTGDELADYAANTNSTLIGIYTDNGDGTYSLNIALTAKFVVIVKSSTGTALKKKPVASDAYMKVEGDNQPSIAP